MLIKPNIRSIAVFGVAFAVVLPMSGQVLAQTVFTKRQIVQQLQIAPNANFNQNDRVRLKRAPTLRRRAPQSHNGPVVMRRAPQPENQPVIRAPQPEGGIREFRAPEPRGVARRRAPPPRAVSPSRAPRREEVNVASVSRERGIEVRPRVEPTLTASDYPSTGRIDLEILFDYDSARIKPSSVKQLVELGEALNDPELGSGLFMIAGHTDAAGSFRYNADLSLRRAHAVTEFLVNFAGVSPHRLQIEGYGESFLKYPDAPESGQNRRVEIINLGDAS